MGTYIHTIICGPKCPQVCGSKETDMDENPCRLRMQSSLLYHRCWIHFPHNIAQLLLETRLPFHTSQLFTSVNWVPFAFGEDFHRMKGRETLSRSNNDLNTTDDNV
jgi:hypothetical protein